MPAPKPASVLCHQKQELMDRLVEILRLMEKYETNYRGSPAEIQKVIDEKNNLLQRLGLHCLEHSC